MGSSVTVQTRVDPALKRDVDAVLDGLGLDMPTAIRMFLVRVRQVSGIPFPVTLVTPSLAAAMDEAERLAGDPATRVYTDVPAMIREILDEPDVDE